MFLQKPCPACRQPFARPLRPAAAIGAAAYMQFCPHCLRELVYGPGIRVRLALVVIIPLAWLAGLFDDPSMTGMILRVFAGLALLGAWFLLPTFTEGPRRFDETSGMAEDVAGDTSPDSRSDPG